MIYQQVLELLNPQPGYRVLDITSHCDALSAAVAEYLRSYDSARLSIVQYPGTHQTLQSDIELKFQDVASFSAPFRALPRDNDIVFIRDVLHRHHVPKRLIKAVYSTLANTGDIVIISQKNETDTQMQLELLEEMEFRAGNAIDLFEDLNVVTAKKMHMWGNGL